ncbi:MAG TPA: YqaE/Pmp3 family membrane protein [Thermoanaerobaculia bacterium]|nr:YqaE/Pmp3 family membrane protein [Thermoanaerobaculia bacterium]
MSLIDILLVIFLPPIAVLKNAGFGMHFLLNILLTIVGWVPGVIHAAWVASSRHRATGPLTA